jgi:DNA-binding transcriptional MerR regulator
MVIRRMKPLGFALEEMRDLLDATDRLDAPGTAGPDRAALLDRVRAYEHAAARKIADLRTQLARAEEFAATLRDRLERDARP